MNIKSPTFKRTWLSDCSRRACDLWTKSVVLVRGWLHNIVSSPILCSFGKQPHQNMILFLLIRPTLCLWCDYLVREGILWATLVKIRDRIKRPAMSLAVVSLHIHLNQPVHLAQPWGEVFSSIAESETDLKSLRDTRSANPAKFLNQNSCSWQSILHSLSVCVITVADLLIWRLIIGSEIQDSK